MIEWFFVISLTMPGLCDTAVCEASGGAVSAEITVPTDETHCRRIRKLIVARFGKARDGRPNIDGTVTECEARTRER